jgi:putative transposase
VSCQQVPAAPAFISCPRSTQVGEFEVAITGGIWVAFGDMVRHSLNYVSWKMRKEVAADLRAVYAAATLEAATTALDEFEQKWGADYPPIVQSWRRNWERITPFFDYPPEVRRIIYTTNAIESVNMSLRKITKNRGAFPSDEALLKLFYLALNNIAKKWTMPVQNWKPVLNRFTIQFGERMPTN